MAPIETRVDQLTELSQAAYRSGLERESTGEEKAQRIVRVGMQVVAHALEDSHGNGLVAGDYLQKYVFSKLKLGEAMDSWPEYRATLRDMPPVRIPPRYDRSLDELSIRYANTTRKTVNQDGSFETDAMHAVHMSSLALPYAAAYYPDLDRSKVAIYILLHDLVEAYAEDVSSLGIRPDQQANKTLREAAALRRIELEQGRCFPRLVQMLIAYEELDDDESKYTKTFDKLDPKFNSLYTRGISLTGYHNSSAAEYEAMVAPEPITMLTSYGSDYPDLVRAHPILTARVVANTDWARSSNQLAA